MTKQAQVMLVHGARADGSCWSKVILLLQAKGITVICEAVESLAVLSADAA
jgi:hypothetical protein